MVGVDHASKIAMYKGKDPVLVSDVKDNPFTTSNVIVTFCPGKGWVGVYDDSDAYGGFYH